MAVKFAEIFGENNFEPSFAVTFFDRCLFCFPFFFFCAFDDFFYVDRKPFQGLGMVYDQYKKIVESTEEEKQQFVFVCSFCIL